MNFSTTSVSEKVSSSCFIVVTYIFLKLSVVNMFLKMLPYDTLKILFEMLISSTLIIRFGKILELISSPEPNEMTIWSFLS